jgi:hypothetical protein
MMVKRLERSDQEDVLFDAETKSQAAPQKDQDSTPKKQEFGIRTESLWCGGGPLGACNTRDRLAETAFSNLSRREPVTKKLNCSPREQKTGTVGHSEAVKKRRQDEKKRKCDVGS